MQENLTFTAENVLDYPAGTKVLINYGAYFADIEGEVVGFKRIPATRFKKEHYVLCVKHEERDCGMGIVLEAGIKNFEGFSKGIGLSLVEIAPVKQNPKKPLGKFLRKD